MKKWTWGEKKRDRYYCLRLSNEELEEIKKRGGSRWLREIVMKAIRKDSERKK